MVSIFKGVFSLLINEYMDMDIIQKDGNILSDAENKSIKTMDMSSSNPTGNGGGTSSNPTGNGGSTSSNPAVNGGDTSSNPRTTRSTANPEYPAAPPPSIQNLTEIRYLTSLSSPTQAQLDKLVVLTTNEEQRLWVECEIATKHASELEERTSDYVSDTPSGDLADTLRDASDKAYHEQFILEKKLDKAADAATKAETESNRGYR